MNAAAVDGIVGVVGVAVIEDDAIIVVVVVVVVVSLVFVL